MTNAGYLVMVLSIIISGFAMFVLGMRFGAKYISKELIKDWDADRDEANKRMNARYGPRKSYSEYGRRIHTEPKMVKDYVIENKDDADTVLANLIQAADKYGHTSLADYYDLIRVETEYRDNCYGWSTSSIKDAKVVPRSHGFTISFPPIQII